MVANHMLFCWIALAALSCGAGEKDPNTVWKRAGADEGLRQAFERVLYRLEDSGHGGYQGVNPSQRLALEFNRDEVRLKHPQGDIALRLTGYGYGGRLRTPLDTKPSVSGNRVEYQRGELSEWYVNDSRGLEQGFALARRPGASRDGEPLVIALGIVGELRPELTAKGDAVLLRSSKGAVLRYTGLRAWDALGRATASRLQVGEREIRLVVEDRDAQYPLVVDPVWTQQAELLASDGKVGDNFGWSVSVSGDTAVIGAYGKQIGSNTGQGAAYVFVRSGGTWSQQQELTASDGATGDEFGWSVSVSGNIAVIGAPEKNIGMNVAQGAAYVFVRSGTTWSQQQELTSSDAGNFGNSVAVDGNEVMVGAPGSTVGMSPNQGAAYEYVGPGPWSLVGRLTASDGQTGDYFGWSVALSGDMAVVGADNHQVGSNGFQGAAYVFMRDASLNWSQTKELTASDGRANDQFGYSVALNLDTALVGAPFRNIGSNAGQGAVYVFMGMGSAMRQQQELTASDGAAGDNFGDSVALSGATALVGAVYKAFGAKTNQGAAYVFVRSGAAWNQQQQLTASDGASMNWFGSSVSLDLSTGVVGATWRKSTTGAAYVFTGPVRHVFNDFVGNGLAGMVEYDPKTGQEYTALSNGDGTYQYIPNLFSAAFDTLHTGDFNGDGKADLVLYNSKTALAYIGMGNGDGTFSFQSLFWSPGYDFVVSGDLNGDGKADFALYNSSTGTMYTAISNGDGTFTYKYTLISKGYTFLRLAEFTGSNNADLFLYNSVTGQANLGVGDGAGGFTFHALSMSPGYNLADSGDLNGDGKVDLIVYNATNGNAATGISDGMGGFTFNPLLISTGFTSVRLADYTVHGQADVTVYNKDTGNAYFGVGAGTGSFAFQSLFWSPGYDYVVPEDVDGDGIADVVLYNSTTGTEYTGLSKGAGTFNYTYTLWGPGKVLAR